METVVHGLWIGESLSILEKLCITSFLRNGYTFNLYTFQPMDVPEGCNLCDAREIITEVFTYQNGSYAAVSNIFRLKVLYKYGGLYTDLDMICLKPMEINQKYIIPQEYTITGEIPWSGMIYCKEKNDPIIGELIRLAESKIDEIKTGKMKWGLGEFIVTNFVDLVGNKYLMPAKNFVSCDFNSWKNILDPKIPIKRGTKKLEECHYFIHCWNEMWRKNGIDKNTEVGKEGSIYNQLIKRYLI
jgi:hypothetical protein